MPGHRYEGWSHVHVKGDKRRAAAYLAYARKLLGYVRQQANFSGIKTLSVTRTLNDGAVVTAEFVDGIPRITITPPPVTSTSLQIEPPDVFVVWARDAGHVNGIDAAHPQQFLKPQWTTSFFNSFVTGFDAFGHNKKNVYVGSFPHGAKHMGNVDWRGWQKERLSWYGPSSRYFFDPFVQPQSQYGKFVFHLGQALLDVEDYITKSSAGSDPQAPFDERWVMGAAFNGTHLHVIMAALPHADTLTDMIAPHTGESQRPYPTPVDGISIVFARFALTFVAGVSLAERTQVVVKSREVLWSGKLFNALNPAFFDPTGVVATMSALPNNPQVAFNVTDPDYVHTHGMISPPSSSSDIHRFNYVAGINGNKPTAQYGVIHIACPPPIDGGDATVTTDWDEKAVIRPLLLRRREIEGTKDAFVLSFNKTEWVLYSESLYDDPDHPFYQRVTANYLLYADLRIGVFMFLHLKLKFDTSDSSIVTQDCNVECWRDGKLVDKLHVDATDLEGCGLPRNYSGTDIYRSCIRDVSVSAMQPFYQTYLSVLDGGLTIRVTFDGNLGTWIYLPYPLTEYFGSYGANDTDFPTTPANVADITDGDFDAHPVDFDGHYSVLGCASDKLRTLFSGYGLKHADGRSQTAIFGKNDGSMLGDLTGISGTNKRYHPIGILGELLPAALNQLP